jgi:hypothetical protein
LEIIQSKRVTMRRFLPALTVLLLLSAAAHAQGDRADRRYLELALSDEAAQLRYDGPTSVGGKDSRVLYSAFLSEDRDVVGSAALLVDSDLQLGALELRFGPQAYAALLDEENEDVLALAVGLEARLNLAQGRALAVVGSAFYSPDILTFGSADNLRDFMARAEMRLSDQLVGFAGYRWFELDVLNREERKLQNEIFAGVRWRLR